MFSWACGMVLGRWSSSRMEEGAVVAASGYVAWLRFESGPALDLSRIGEVSCIGRKVWQDLRFAAADRWIDGGLLLFDFGFCCRSMGFGCLGLRWCVRSDRQGSAGTGDLTLVVERQEWWGSDGAGAAGDVICRWGSFCRQRPWWSAVLPWWIAALSFGGEWWLGRVLVLGPCCLAGLWCLVFSSVFGLSCLVFCSFWVFMTPNKSFLLRGRVVSVMNSGVWFELDCWFWVCRAQSFAGFWPCILLSACAEVSWGSWDSPLNSYLLWFDPILVNATYSGLATSISPPIQPSFLYSLTVHCSVFRVSMHGDSQLLLY
ncbi:hypothetical protein RchiOBHm_Chr7g0218611 [Rosa chinensis]|uniref:Transmembrane protein n=1 Tax=Rosa chinensis TaxID=74649 RepID=A0A2P6PCC2_ROSCH|nr:hypothetical protein RchiOBHm_Chr7g0218611 [Rosa chinensis]